MRYLLIILFPLFTNAQDTSFVEIGEGSNLFFRIVTHSDSDTIFTDEIQIAQSNNGSAFIKKKVKWFLKRVTGTGLKDWHYVDNYGVKVDVIKYKNPKNNKWLDAL